MLFFRMLKNATSTNSLKGEDVAQLNSNKEALEAAKVSVYEDIRLIICFLCLGNNKLPTQSRTYSFYTSGDLSKHFKRKHLLSPLSREVVSRGRKPLRGTHLLACRSQLQSLLAGASMPRENRVEESTQGTSIIVNYPLDPQVKALIENGTSRDTSDGLIVVSQIEAAMEKGKKLHCSGGRTVTQIHPNIVVKAGRDLDLNEVTITEHIHQVSSGFPSPQPLGAVTCNRMAFIFMTFIEGTSLQELWPSLSAENKMAVSDQLNTLLFNLRSLPLPSTQLGGGVPPRCKDVRRTVRYSSGPIDNEDEFNNFLLSPTKPRIAQTYKEFIRTKCLRSNHRVVMTHGDFHPRNILAKIENGNVKVTGIIDWEAGGSYPEYWEYVKSLNTMSSVDEDDWCDWLPARGMGEFPKEWAVDMLLETLIA
ncbi:kinase-like domain-containing protein [Clohesyomyces aquaticus]|uniref:Kinase-like domain-containing protein n=1 Tax=Clohesyomyces aquaticus TaxID=1231657 RepID=A0A1Y1Y8R3_9PLEO|nr:kinase-like domain-containing protein [Clohesyomyces aquaticus]